MKFLTPKRLFQVHGWLGLNLGLLLFIVCFSGTVAVFSHEIDWLLNPDIRVAPSADGQRRGWGTIHRSVRAAYPEAEVLRMNAPLGSRFASEIVIRTPEDQIRRVYVNPYTGAVQGDTSYFNVKRFFRSFHRRLFVLNPPWVPDGVIIVGAFGFVLLFSALTGFLFYKNWLKNLFTLRWARGGRVAWSDLHRLLGVWTLAFAVLFGATGLWYFAEKLMQQNEVRLSAPLPRLSEAKLAGHSPDPEMLPLERAVEIARETYPSLDINAVWLSSGGRSPLRIIGQADAWLARDRANAVLLDPYDGEVIGVQRGEDLAALPRWVDMADPVHFGTFGGLTTKLIWFLAGLALSISILTGGYIWYLRTRKAAPPRRRRIETAASFAFTIALLGLSGYYAYYGVLRYGTMGRAPEVPLSVQAFIIAFLLATAAISIAWFHLLYWSPLWSSGDQGGRGGKAAERQRRPRAELSRAPA